MKLTELLREWHLEPSVECDVIGLHHDSRQIKPGYLFLAYPGATSDGRLYIQQAVQLGAVAVIYDPIDLPVDCVLPKDIPCVPVENLAVKIAAIASRFYHHPSQSLDVVGVTGTNGKTTIAYQLAQAHALLGSPAAYIGTIGQGQVHALQPLMNTTPDALCLQALLHDYKQQGLKQICMEVSSHALSLGRVAGTDFSQAIFTNLTHDHLDFHQTMQAYAEAKASFFAWPTLKWAIINQDDAYGTMMGDNLPATCKKITYGMHEGCDVRATNVKITMTGSAFDVATPWGRFHVKTRTLGTFNVYNSLAVFASLLAHGYPASMVVPVMATLQASPGRMEVVSDVPCVIVDYAHTPDALENVLSTLAQLNVDSERSGQLWVVFGCGGDRDKTKRPMMGCIANQYADHVILTSDNPRTEDPRKIIEDIVVGLPSTPKVKTLVDREQGIYHALQNAAPQDIILIAGKGHESYQQIGNQRFAFSDQVVVQKWLTRL